MEKVTGYVTGVNGNLVSARFSGSVRKNEVGFVKICLLYTSPSPRD